MRGRPRKQDAADKTTMALREANRRAYAKRTGKPVPPKKDVFMDAIKAKQAQAAAERKLLNDTIDAVMQDAQTVESAEQAQAIAEIKRYMCKTDMECGFVHIQNQDGEFVMYPDHKAIVDSQAQKIAEQAKEIERLKQMVRDIDPEREP